MNRDLLSYCITDRASFKAVARAMMKRDGKWPKQIIVDHDVYRRLFNEVTFGEPAYGGFSFECAAHKPDVWCVVEEK